MKNMVSCNAMSKATVLSLGSLELLHRASVFTMLSIHNLNEMGGTTLLREVLGTKASYRTKASLQALLQHQVWTTPDPSEQSIIPPPPGCSSRYDITVLWNRLSCCCCCCQQCCW